MSRWDSEMVKLNNMGYRPAKIATILRAQEDLTAKVMNSQSVDSRLRYLKQQGLAKLAPVNDISGVMAREPPRLNGGCKLVCFLFSLLPFSQSFS